MPSPNKKLRILIAGGGTGGHLFPGIAIAQAFEDRFACDIRFVGTHRPIDAEVVPKAGYRLYKLSVSGLYRVGFLKKVLGLAKLPWSVLQSLSILLSFRPHVVIGVGGYASGPMLALSLLLGKKTVIQEQNAFPGLTNRILGKRVPLSFVPFEGLEGIFLNPIVIGNPLRKPIMELAGKPDVRSWDKLVLSVIGGSQGASILNMRLLETLPLLKEHIDRFRIIHQTGPSQFEQVKAGYEKFPDIQAEVSPFIEDIASVYAQSHLVICRAGSIVNELVAAGRASILVPIEISSGDHQKKNAEKLAEHKAAIALEQKQLTAENLAAHLEDLILNPNKIREMESQAKALFPGDAASLIVEEIGRFYGLSG